MKNNRSKSKGKLGFGSPKNVFQELKGNSSNNFSSINYSGIEPHMNQS